MASGRSSHPPQPPWSLRSSSDGGALYAACHGILVATAPADYGGTDLRLGWLLRESRKSWTESSVSAALYSEEIHARENNGLLRRMGAIELFPSTTKEEDGKRSRSGPPAG